MAKRGRPATGQTPQRNIRIPDHVWNAALEKAAERGETISDVLRRALERYVRSR